MPRTRPSVRIHISIAHHRKSSDAWADLEKRAVLVEILRLAGERYAGRTGDRVSLRLPDRMAAACSEDSTEADRRVEEACSAMGWRVDRYPNRWDVTIRNFAKKQGFGGQELDTVLVREKPKTSASDSDSDSDSDSKSKEREMGANAPAADAARPRRNLIEKPDAFPPESRQRLLAWASRKGYERSILNAGLELFLDWEPQKPPYRRTIEQWEGSFKKITREAVGDGKIARTGDAVKPKGQAYASANEMLAERRRAFEAESGETVVDNVIDLLTEGMGK